ncbi:MAG TPA: hypothetical protein VN226_05160, partial [Anaerolineales bacterium]|nr:hypothetical protein [Anaerolineales bacterium]
MIKLFPYIRKYYLMIAVVIILLFIQAMADLTLPDYLADIVNYGIQPLETQESAGSATVESQSNLVLNTG